MGRIMDFEECIHGIKQAIEKRRIVDYASKSSIRRYNKAYDDCFACMRCIEKYYPDKMEQLLDMIESDNGEFTLHCGPMIFLLESSTHEQKVKALTAIKRTVDLGNVDRLDRAGFQISIKKWEAELFPE